jgi:hypothetical protein
MLDAPVNFKFSAQPRRVGPASLEPTTSVQLREFSVTQVCNTEGFTAELTKEFPMPVVQV